MPKTIAPVPSFTVTGAALPFVSLPQSKLLTVNESAVPMIKDPVFPGIHLQPLRLDLEAGVWVVLGTFAPGAEVPLHYHTGPAEVYTLQGRWHYKEYPDQPQTAGSYLYEPGGSVHTLEVDADSTEDTIMLIRVTGSNINFTDDGNFHSILDAVTLRHLIDTVGDEQGLGDISYIGGGEAALTADGT